MSQQVIRFLSLCGSCVLVAGLAVGEARAQDSLDFGTTPGVTINPAALDALRPPVEAPPPVASPSIPVSRSFLPGAAAAPRAKAPVVEPVRALTPPKPAVKPERKVVPVSRPPAVVAPQPVPRLSPGRAPVQDPPAVQAAQPVLVPPPVEARPLTPPPQSEAPGASVTAPLPVAAAPPPPVQSSVQPPPRLDPAQPVTLAPVTLAYDKAETDLPAGASALLGDIAKAAAADPGRRVTILAYATAEGSGGGNRAKRLSLTRALTVRSFLIDKGVRSPAIEVRALGDLGGTPRDRVELTLSP